MLHQIIILAVLVLIGFLIGIAMKIKKGIIPALLIIAMLLADYYIININLITVLGITLSLLTIVKGLLAGMILRSLLK